MNKDLVYVGVDVGTGSVRAAFFSGEGDYLMGTSKTITIHNPFPDIYEQSSSEIWSAVCSCISELSQTLKDKESSKSKIGGIGFTATCSLVAIGPNNKGLSVDPQDDDNWDVIMWMDHRAKQEATEINKMGHDVLQSVGGSISLEMQTPKLMWLKKNKPNVWNNVIDFFDLPDFLTWKATGQKKRSLCSAVCKWTYNGDGGNEGWSSSYFRAIGLGDLVDQNFSKIGQEIVSPGTLISDLEPEAMKVMNLDQVEKIPVAASLIDAHSGALGMLATKPAIELRGNVFNQLGIIAGTSTCHMILNNLPVNIPGVWGPYDSAILEDMWLHEGGQSSVGSLLDHIIQSHPAYDEATANAKINKISIQEHLVVILEKLQKEKGESNLAFLTKDFHVWPDFHGNRSPVADPNLKGMMCGLTLERSVENLALTFLAVMQALAYGTKHIAQELQKKGCIINVATICGGLSQSDVFIQTNADVLQLNIVRPHQVESVLLGAAMLGAAASKSDKDKESSKSKLLEVINEMGKGGEVYSPDTTVADYHEKKFKVFLEMLEDQRKYKAFME